MGHFAPKFAQLNDNVLFGEVWSREDKLSLRDRSLVTVVALMAQGLVSGMGAGGTASSSGRCREHPRRGQALARRGVRQPVLPPGCGSSRRRQLQRVAGAGLPRGLWQSELRSCGNRLPTSTHTPLTSNTCQAIAACGRRKAGVTLITPAQPETQHTSSRVPATGRAVSFSSGFDRFTAASPGASYAPGSPEAPPEWHCS